MRWLRSYRWLREVSRHLFLLSIAVLFLSCSSSSGKISGTVIYKGVPVEGATVEVFLDEEDFGGGRSFVSGATGKDGKFLIHTGRGIFFLVARKVERVMGRENVLRGRVKEAVSPDSGENIVIELEPVADGGIDTDEGTRINGKVITKSGDLEGTYVFAYNSKKQVTTGPTFVSKAPVDASGNFTLPLNEGSFSIVAMRKETGTEVGPISESGLRAEYAHNPVVLKKGEARDVGVLELKRPDPLKAKRGSKMDELKNSGYVITGLVSRESGEPAERMYVMAYADRRMIGRPDSISRPTDERGVFTLFLPGPGKYYIGARESIGGPMSPGELSGKYEGTPDYSIDLTEMMRIDDLQIVVREK